MGGTERPYCQWQEISWSGQGTQVQPNQGRLQTWQLAEEEHSQREEETLDDCPRTLGEKTDNLGRCLGRNKSWIKPLFFLLFGLIPVGRGLVLRGSLHD